MAATKQGQTDRRHGVRILKGGQECPRTLVESFDKHIGQRRANDQRQPRQGHRHDQE